MIVTKTKNIIMSTFPEKRTFGSIRVLLVDEIFGWGDIGSYFVICGNQIYL